MSELIKLAIRFAEEWAAKRGDITGAVAHGSAIHGERTPVSDIDVRLLSRDAEPCDADRDQFGQWRAGIFIDGSISSVGEVMDTDAVLSDPYLSTWFVHGRVIYDPSGAVEEARERAETSFPKSRWVEARARRAFDDAQKNVTELTRAIEREDEYDVLCHGGFAFHYLGNLAMVSRRVRLRSVRGLHELSNQDPDTANRIRELETQRHLRPDEFLNLLHLFDDMASESPEGMTQLIRHWLIEARWMAETGLHREAFHALLTLASLCFRGDDAAVDEVELDRRDAVAKKWLGAIDWLPVSKLRSVSLELNELLVELSEGAYCGTTDGRG